MVQILMRFDESFRHARGNIQSTLMQLLFSFDRGMRVEKTLVQTLVSQLWCSFDQCFYRDCLQDTVYAFWSQLPKNDYNTTLGKLM
jgi:hypothetical protein